MYRIKKKSKMNYMFFFYISAVKRLTTNNHIQIKSFCLHSIYYVYIVFIYTYYYLLYTCMYIFQKNMLCLYIKYIYLLNQLYEYKYRHVNIFKIYACVYFYIYIQYIHNKYTQNTHIYYANKNVYFGLNLINRLTALKNIYFNYFILFYYYLFLLYIIIH